MGNKAETELDSIRLDKMAFGLQDFSKPELFLKTILNWGV